MNIGRMKEMSRFLRSDAIPDDRFYLAVVVDSQESIKELGEEAGGFVPLEDTDLYKDGNGVWVCGSAACAMGWAPANPAFAREGLVYSPVTGLEWTDHRGITSRGWDQVAQAFFGLSSGEVFELFGPEEYEGSPTKEEVADRIDMLIELYEEEEKDNG